MIKKTISWTSVFDEERIVTQDYYFGLTKMEMMEISVVNDFENRIRKIMAAKDVAGVLREFKSIIKASVGYRDGEDFVKTPEFATKFVNSPAMDELLMELIASEDQGASFMAGILPKDMQQGALEKLKETGPNPFADEPEWLTSNRTPTPAEFNAATEEQRQLAFARAIQAQSVQQDK